MKTYLDYLYRGTIDDFHHLLSRNLKKKKKMFIVTANPEMYMLAQKDKKLESIVTNPDYTVVADGIGVVKACQLLKIEGIHKITGVDTALYLLQQGNKLKLSVYLLGAKDEVIQALADKVKQEYPGVKLVGYHHGYEKEKNKIMEEIVQLSPDIVMVALGIPEQEKLIHQYYSIVQKGIFIGVGGSFDVLSGSKKRAPKIVQTLNLEWLYRIIKEPKRLKRFYHNNIKFIFKIKK